MPAPRTWSKNQVNWYFAACRPYDVNVGFFYGKVIMKSNLTTTSTQNHLLSILLMSFLALLITTGNVLSLSIFLGCRRFRTPQGYLKVSLAVADLAVGVIVVPYSVYKEIGDLMTALSQTLVSGSNSSSVEEKQDLHGDWGGVRERGFQPCFITGTVFAGCTLVSISTIFLLSLERVITVLRPLQKNVIVTKERTLGLIVFTWLLCSVMALCPLLSAQGITLQYSPCSKMCNYAPCLADKHQHPLHDPLGHHAVPSHTSHSSILLLFPVFDFTMLGSTCVINAVTFSAVRSFCRGRMQETAPATSAISWAKVPVSSGPSFSDIRAAKTILVLTALFCISFVPVAVQVMASVLGSHWCGFSLYAFWILACSSGWNVLVYSARDPRFRQRSRELLLGRRAPSNRRGQGRRRRTGKMRPPCRRWWRYHHHHLHASATELWAGGGVVEGMEGMSGPEQSQRQHSCRVHVSAQQELTCSTLVTERSFIHGSPQESPAVAHSLRVSTG